MGARKIRAYTFLNIYRLKIYTDNCIKCLQANKADAIHTILKSDDFIDSSHLFQMHFI